MPKDAFSYEGSNHENLRKKYGLKSREIVENDMSEDFILKRTISVYEKNI